MIRIYLIWFACLYTYDWRCDHTFSVKDSRRPGPLGSQARLCPEHTQVGSLSVNKSPSFDTTGAVSEFPDHIFSLPTSVNSISLLLNTGF
ncbi:hypothetical protein BDZ94DRAFT_1263431, partial [Collybia nuda]